MLTLHKHAKLIELKKKYKYELTVDGAPRNDEDLLASLLILDTHHAIIANLQSLYNLYPKTSDDNENIKVIFHLLGLISGQTFNTYGKSIAEPEVLKTIFFKSFSKEEDK